jgi:geranylgeranyl pyrophosphate synthase
VDLYPAIEEWLAQRPPVSDWPELRAVLHRASGGRPSAWELPVTACVAVGGSPEQALPVAAAIAGLQTSIILIDDELDADPRGEHQRPGLPATANLAAALQGLALDALLQADAAAPALLAALRCLNAMVLATAWGQYLDSQNPAGEEAYWTLVRAKSAPFFGAALEAGALLGGAVPELAARLGALGRLYGEMVQIHDDLQDVMETPANPDWLLGRRPLPILFAEIVNHPEQARFLELRSRAARPECLAEAQRILIHCGGVSYATHELLERHRAALVELQAMSLANSSGLRRMLAKVVEPIEHLASELTGVER